jgi:hypothetical protein
MTDSPPEPPDIGPEGPWQAEDAETEVDGGPPEEAAPPPA